MSPPIAFPSPSLSTSVFGLTLAVLSLWIITPPALCQTAASSGGATTESVRNGDQAPVVRGIEFEGNRSIPDRTLSQLIRTRTNRQLFGIRGLTPWYAINRITKRFGEPPALLDEQVLSSDVERIRLFYESRGFFYTTIQSRVDTRGRGRGTVTFEILEGRRATIREISYSGLPDGLSDEVMESFIEEGPDMRERLGELTFTYSRSYNLQMLRNEQERILNTLRNNGYASVVRDSVQVLIRRDSLDPVMLDIQFLIRPGMAYRFGDIDIRLLAPAGVLEDSTQHLSIPRFVMQSTAGDSVFSHIRISKDEQAHTKWAPLLSSLNFSPGQTFDQRLFQNSVSEFQNLGMVNVVRFGYREAVRTPEMVQPLLPTFFDLQANPKYALQTELFGMERYGFGTGVGLNFNNNNLRGGAENISFRLNSSFEFVSSSTLKEISIDPQQRQSAEGTVFQSYDATLQYAVPRLNYPFRSLEERPFFRNSFTRYSLSFSRANQLYFNINSDVRFNIRFEVNHSQRRRSFFDLTEWSVIDTDPSPEFEQNLQLQFPGDTLQIIRIREDFRPQFTTAVRYLHRYSTTDLIKKNKGEFNEVSFTVGGQFPYLIDRFLVTPGQLERNLPSPFGISTNSLEYDQFVKVTLDHRRYVPLTDLTVVSWRLFGGYAQPFSNSQSVPLNQRFFAGGSNDIRAWPPFRLGPGGVASEDVVINGAEIKLAAFTEVRQLVTRDLLSGEWHLGWFVDTGNIWYRPGNRLLDQDGNNLLEPGTFALDSFYKQIAVGSGLGLRIDWDFVVARVDFSFRVHDLQQGWFENRKMYFSFGIGHSF